MAAGSTKSTSKKQAMLEALSTSMGIISTACDKVGIDRRTHYNWLRDDADYAKSVEDIAEAAIDRGESALYNLIDAGNPTAVIFFLKTKAKKRGYTESTTLELSADTAKKLIDISFVGKKQ